MIKKVLKINGLLKTIITKPDAKLSDVLRRQLSLTGTKFGCGVGECGACNVIMNGEVVRSCIVRMERVEDWTEIVTIEGIGDHENLHPLQFAWMIHGAAQCGFCSPGFIVSAKVLLDENKEPTREEVRDWFQKTRNVCRCTGYVPLVDAVMTAAEILRGEVKEEDLWFKLPEGASIIGTNYVRPSAAEKVTGAWDFGADLGVKLPEDTLHIKLVQAEVHHANIISIDTSEAEKMPGVHMVLTHKDVKGNNSIDALGFPEREGDGLERPILSEKKVNQYGDVLAMVLADSPERAKAACEKVKVELEELPAYMNPFDAMAEDAVEIHPGTPNVFFEIKNIKGEEVDPIFEECDYVVEDEFRTSRQPHLVIEPDVGFAYFNEKGKLNIHSNSVALHFHAAMISGGIGLPLEDIALIQNNTGATFGYKFNPTNEGLLGVAAMATDRPVYLEFDMHQQITYTGKRGPFHTKLKLGANKDGKLQAMKSDWTIDHGAYTGFGDLLATRGAQLHGAGYDVPNIRGEGRSVLTNHVYAAAFRGFGAPQSLFSTELLMDKLAEEMDMDPLELRYKNIYREGSLTPTGAEPEVICFPEMFDTMRPLYKRAKEESKEKNDKSVDKKYGVGLALMLVCAGLDGPDTADAWVELTGKGITVSTSWEDHGQGADMGILAHTYEKLRPIGVPIHDIKMVMNDMNIVPNSGPAGGSRSTIFVGNAIADACHQLMETMKKEDGSYRTYEEMVNEELPVKYVGTWTAPKESVSVETGQGDPFQAYIYGLLMSEVEVDLETGKTVVEKLTMISDAGTIMNKLVVDGQIYGGLAQGIGFALTEDFEDYKKHTTLTRCGIPQIKDIPDNIELIYQETKRPLSEFGASGVGELPNTGSHASVINAIYDACGVRITELPATPEKIKEELDKIK